MKLKKTLILLSILFIMLIIPALSFAQGDCPDWDRDNHTDKLFRFLLNQRWWTWEILENKLELTDDQIEQLEEVYLEYNKGVIDLRATLHSKRFDLEYLLQQEEYDMEKLEVAVEEMTSAAKELEEFELMSRIKMLNVLTTEQRKTLMAAMFKFMKNKGPKFDNNFKDKPGHGNGPK